MVVRIYKKNCQLYLRKEKNYLKNIFTKTNAFRRFDDATIIIKAKFLRGLNINETKQYNRHNVR